jgi:hypothetical protein
MVDAVKIFFIFEPMAINTEPLQLYIMYGNGKQDCLLAIVTRLGTGQLRYQGLIPGRDKTYFFLSSLQYPGPLCSLLSLATNEYMDLFPGG